MSVKNLLTEQKIPYKYVKLGEVEIENKLTKEQLNRFSEGLLDLGFELLKDPASETIEKVKTALIEIVQQGIEEHFSLQKYLSSKIFKDYSSVSRLFSSVEGITIEQYFILQKIEKVKELIIYNELSISEIAFRLGYNSTQHLSSQFKSITGMTPSAFRSQGNDARKPIDKI